MFVRWKNRSGVRGSSQYCYLCHSERVNGKVKAKTVAYVGSISEKLTKPEREIFWIQVKVSLDKLNLVTDERAKIEAAIAQKVPRGRNSHGDSDAPVEWYTPPEYIEIARSVLGKIDLDPASNALAQTWIKADKYFTIEDDGLKQEWHGRVWCNPPYGRTVNLWLEKAIAQYQSGNTQEAILLLNRTGATWYTELKKNVSAICEAKKRIAFLDATGKRQKSPRYYNDFLYLGSNVELFSKKYTGLGEVRIS
jgi:phage N-6-adenine-methyltransferase